jgi:hypothetical protein
MANLESDMREAAKLRGTIRTFLGKEVSFGRVPRSMAQPERNSESCFTYLIVDA